MREWIALTALTALLLSACQTTGGANVEVWQEAKSSRLEIGANDLDSKIVSHRRRDLVHGWQEDIQFSDARIIVTALIDRYFNVLPLSQERAQLLQQFKAVMDQGFEPGEFSQEKDQADPIFFGVARKSSESCMMFRKYTNHPSSSHGYLQSDEHKTANLSGLYCVADGSAPRIDLLTGAKRQINRVRFKEI